MVIISQDDFDCNDYINALCRWGEVKGSDDPKDITECMRLTQQLYDFETKYIKEHGEYLL